MSKRLLLAKGNNEEKQVVGDINSEYVSKNKLTVRSRKRKRQDSESSSDIGDNLPENTLETEKNLQTLAIKNHLDDVSVKKILKKVVTNDHVLALVKMREEEDSRTEGCLQPKLTRAKAKELREVSSGNAWHHIELTPIKHIPVKTRPEVTALIAQELPEDEDDEEYEPTHDDSDDDVTCSDLDSLPRTPATPAGQRKESPAVVRDGPFKVPQEATVTVRKKLLLEEEATIALRTRSKLSLSETPIEHIESSFIPPDDLPMPDVDDLWNEFLSECLNPESKTNEDDDEQDPEYNVAADPDANDEDEEALEKSIIKISKKELNDLVTELMNVMPEGVENQLTAGIQGDQNQGTNGVVDTAGLKTRLAGPANKTDLAQTHWDGKQEPISDEESQTKTTNIASKITFESSNVVTRVSVGKIEIENEDGHGINKDGTQHNASNSDKIKNTEVSITGSSNVLVTVPRTITISVEERELQVMEAPPLVKPPPSLRKIVAAPPQIVKIEIDNTVQMSPEQVTILQQQLRQHIQLATSNFLQLYVHPVHWTYGPEYKDYLETFHKIVIANPKSVVNVCNLIPAVELVRTWQETVSADTEENKKMVEFVQDEVEKCRRRNAANNLYTGDFPELIKKVIANSPVFLYPYMLPPTPYRAVHTNRRFSYMKSEDALIVLGLDQFWWYVENNPDIFKQPSNHPRRRWGLRTTVNLICKHMLPWLTPKALLGHIQSVRKTNVKSNPIVQYFVENTIDPVRHKILPFNPKLTLYEHPEIEMPRLWIKYLSINSKRFKVYSNRRVRRTLQPPQGVEIQTGQPIQPIQKGALPIDFVKPITCDRVDALPKTPQLNYVDKYDIQINTTSQNAPNTNVHVASNIYTLIQTSTGAKLMPLTVLQTSTVDTSTHPICSTTVSNTYSENDKRLESLNNEIGETSTKQLAGTNASKKIEQQKHCPCCILLRKICKVGQQLITDYFKPNIDQDKPCEKCVNKKYPRITNKLRILVNNYKTHTHVLYAALQKKLVKNYVANKNEDESDINYIDFASAISYQTKLLMRVSLVRNKYLKQTIHRVFSKFDVECDDPLLLTNKLLKVFNVDLADMFKEFLGFLTPEQALSLGHFKEYFVENCYEDLIKKVEEQVQDRVKGLKIFNVIKKVFICESLRPCDLCCELMTSMQEYPELVEYVFSLFPHAVKREFSKGANKSPTTCQKPKSTNVVTILPSTIVAENLNTTCRLSESMCEVRRNGCEESAATVKSIKAVISSSDEEPQLALDEDIEPSTEDNTNKCGDERREDNQDERIQLDVDEDMEVPTEDIPNKCGDERGENNQDERLQLAVDKDMELPTEENSNECGDERGEDNQDERLQLAVDEDMELPPEDNPNECGDKRGEDNQDERLLLITTIKYEPVETCELTIIKTEVQENSESDMSIVVMSEDDSIKSEPLEWTREEDKLILEFLKQYLTPEERSDKTIIEIIKEKDLLNIITNKLSHKSLEDVTERVLYLLQILILSE